jgi:putative FmdB family regulatory protein
MPLYEYKCNSCGTVFEVIQRFSDQPLKVHQNCGGELRRLISRSALQFKGTGWYVTDYAKGSNGKGAPGSPSLPEADSAKDKATPKTESKPSSGSSESTAKK